MSFPFHFLLSFTQIIISKDERISELERQISELEQKHRLDLSNKIREVHANLTAKVNAAESRALHAEEQARTSVRAERAIASHRISVMKKESSAVQHRDRRDLMAITEATKDEMKTEKDKAEFLAKANLKLRREHQEEVDKFQVEMKRKSKDLKKHFSQDLLAKNQKINQQISAVREKGKEAAISRLDLAHHEKRTSKECHAAAEVATKERIAAKAEYEAKVQATKVKY